MHYQGSLTDIVPIMDSVMREMKRHKIALSLYIALFSELNSTWPPADWLYITTNVFMRTNGAHLVIVLTVVIFVNI